MLKCPFPSWNPSPKAAISHHGGGQKGKYPYSGWEKYKYKWRTIRNMWGGCIPFPSLLPSLSPHLWETSSSFFPLHFSANLPLSILSTLPPLICPPKPLSFALLLLIHQPLLPLFCQPSPLHFTPSFPLSLSVNLNHCIFPPHPFLIKAPFTLFRQHTSVSLILRLPLLVNMSFLFYQLWPLQHQDAALGLEQLPYCWA